MPIETRSSACGDHLYSLVATGIAGDGRHRRVHGYDPTASVLFVLAQPIATSGPRGRTWRTCLAVARALGASRMGLVFLRSGAGAADPVGVEADEWLGRVFADRRARVICAWGDAGRRLGRDRDALAIARSHGVTVYCLGMTDRGAPRPPQALTADERAAPQIAVFPTRWVAR